MGKTPRRTNLARVSLCRCNHTFAKRTETTSGRGPMCNRVRGITWCVELPAIASSNDQRAEEEVVKLILNHDGCEHAYHTSQCT